MPLPLSRMCKALCKGVGWDMTRDYRLKAGVQKRLQRSGGGEGEDDDESGGGRNDGHKGTEETETARDQAGFSCTRQFVCVVYTYTRSCFLALPLQLCDSL